MTIIQPVYALICSLAVALILNSSEVLANDSESEVVDSKKTVLVWGDSLSAAYGIPVEKGWVNLLQAKYRDDLNVINASISGETTQGGLSRLPAALTLHKPDLVLLELGANDGLRGIKTEVMQENLTAMIELIKAAGSEQVLLGIRIPLNYGFTYTQKFEQVYVDLAKQFELPFLPFLLESVALDYDLMQSDGLHPTADAQPQVLGDVLTVVGPAVEKLLGQEDQTVSQNLAQEPQKDEVVVTQ
ncbi:arylesterase [Leucothrix arctica]|uniref:Arylesterase n=1 Tax=Leucothrix arctica TaxID=1481894 RepID=A0A317CEN2_9GAMM|nr:arylesterase [Leucothrix arctica]PWQ96996.1 arylesterase [Leucothrix arctica]